MTIGLRIHGSARQVEGIRSRVLRAFTAATLVYVRFVHHYRGDALQQECVHRAVGIWKRVSFLRCLDYLPLFHDRCDSEDRSAYRADDLSRGVSCFFSSEAGSSLAS
jgi:hypothetical protein